mmetsp:Transcript_29215/g.93427  ORF Transcript_29215/g.93427 Transcript_29215/m.93427 type:complete len:679 (-) Transcript_29215:22-2058(-)
MSPQYPLNALWLRSAAIVIPALLSWHTMLHGFALTILYAVWIREIVTAAPYYSDLVNRLFAAMYSTLLWASAVLFIRGLITRTESNADMMTICLFAGAIPAALAGWALMTLRLRRPRDIASAFVRDPGLAYAKDQFTTVEEVLIATTCMRIKQRDEMLMQELYKGAESLLNSGQNQFRRSPLILVANGNFKMRVRADLTLARKQFEDALLLPLAMSLRFQVYSALQNHKELLSTLDLHDGGGGKSAGVNYSDFQRQLKQAINIHRVVLNYHREFWKELANHRVKMSALMKWMTKMDKAENRAMMTYTHMLKQHPKNTRLMRAFAGYLEEVKQSSHEASAMLAKADDMDQDLVEKQREQQLQSLSSSGNGKRDPSKLVDQVGDYEYHEPMFVITRFGILREANKAANRLFGYSKGEVIGKNVSMLMPAPFSTMHNSFLRNYCLSGQARILGSDRDVVGIHKDRHIFPLIIHVNSVELDGEDLFAGVIVPKDEDPSTAVLYATAEGVVLCANRVTKEMLGFETADVVGKTIADFTHDSEIITERAEIELANFNENVAKGEDDSPPLSLTFLHKFNVDVPVNLRVRIGGTANHKILVLEMQQEGGVISGVATVTASGRIEEVTKAFAGMTGHSRAELAGSEIFKIIPKSYAPFHKKWLGPSKQHGSRGTTHRGKAGPPRHF